MVIKVDGDTHGQSRDAGTGSVASTSISFQRLAWNAWNAEYQAHGTTDLEAAEKKVVLSWLSRLGRTDLDIIEVGCGAAWLCPALKQFGRVTATDLSDEVLARARVRIPHVNFVAGDFMALNFDDAAFDVVVTLQVLAHVADQPAFVRKLAHLLRPNGLLVMASQNRPVLERFNPYPSRPGQLRRWTDRRELETLLADDFEMMQFLGMAPRASRGVMRLVAGKEARRIMRRLTGDLWEQALASAGLASNLMVLARKRG